MDAIQWSEALRVGVDTIDSQHQTLFARVNELMALSREGASANRAAAARIIGYLDSYVIMHFNDEERLQQKEGYPGYEAHKKEHEAFKQRFTVLREKFIREGLTADLAVGLEDLLVRWLVDHVTQRDKEIGHFLNRKNGG